MDRRAQNQPVQGRATRRAVGLNFAALPRKRGRESPLWIDLREALGLPI
jgi:hypothetical protein